MFISQRSSATDRCYLRTPFLFSCMILIIFEHTSQVLMHRIPILSTLLKMVIILIIFPLLPLTFQARSGDLLCQPLQSFHGLIRNLRSQGSESRTETCTGRGRESRSRAKTVQRACLLTSICQHEGGNQISETEAEVTSL